MIPLIRKPFGKVGQVYTSKLLLQLYQLEIKANFPTFRFIAGIIEELIEILKLLARMPTS